MTRPRLAFVVAHGPLLVLVLAAMLSLLHACSAGSGGGGYYYGRY